MSAADTPRRRDPRSDDGRQQAGRPNRGREDDERPTAGREGDRPGHGDRRNRAGRQRNRGRTAAAADGADRSGRAYSATAPSSRRRRADPARLAAYHVLRAVSGEDAYGNLVLPREIRAGRLGRQDAAFATELTYGTLRARGTYDRILACCVDRDLDRLDPEVLDALRLGAHQLLGMRVSAHAAVDESVALVRDRIGAGPAGLVNAVLRKVARREWEGWMEQLRAEAPDNEAERLGVEHYHPAWVVRALGQSLRWHSAGELEALLAADNIAPEVHLVQLPGAPADGADYLSQAMESGATPSALVSGAAAFRGGDVARLPGVGEGWLRVQDIGSQWIARALAAAPTDTEDGTARGRWLDLCAGPGGKAALLAALAGERDAHLVANEPLEHRAELVARALAPLDESSWTITRADGRTLDAETAGRFDRILLDAPCTGLGALRRRPEARWRRSPADLAELTVLQQELLDAAVELLAPGGVLGYVTCSPHLAETVVQVEDALSRHPELQVADARRAMRAVAEPDGAALIPDSGEGLPGRVVQLWPHVHGTDAMFFALLHKP